MIHEEFGVRTTRHAQFVDITRQVQDIVSRSGIENGVCTVFVPHTTAAVTINENADPNVVSDVLAELDKIVPWQDGYHHIEGNSAAHIKSSMLGCSEQVIVEGGRLKLGTWQGIYFAEFDGPRARKVWVSVS
ncbi:MAG: secondary thiamine-phosphate synthase enzyme YjbQ [Coriobacteriales bacterium]|jgi:secondary thiamine-phosphate synthase enzyme